IKRPALGRPFESRVKRRSVPCGYRGAAPSAEAVVDADGDEIDVLTDAIGAEEDGSRRVEGVGAILHEQVVVFEADRAVGSEAEFDAGADHATPAGVVIGGGGENVGSDHEGAVAIRSHRGAALHVEEDVVGGPADLAGDQAERVDPRVVDKAGSKQADPAAAE